MADGSRHIAFIGFGEAAQAFSRDLGERGAARISACDLRFGDAAGELRRRARALGVETAASAAAAIAGAELIVSAVTAGAAAAVADEAARAIARDQFYLDINAVAPATKRRAARAIDAAGGRFVEAAVMGPVAPHGLAVPLAIGGPHARALAPLLAGLGFNAEPVGDEVGAASAIKMCRSIMMKGMEALMVECMVAARSHGVERQVIESLDATLPGIDWGRRAGYVMGRAIRHGRRRGEEVREAAAMVAELGIEPHMADATAARQQWVADLGLEAGPEDAGYAALADRLLAAL